MSEVLNQDQAIAIAKRNGCSIIQGSPTTLLLDLDTPASRKHFNSFLKWLQNEAMTVFLGVELTDMWVSKSGRGKHVVLTLKTPLPLTSRLLLQSALGSDPKKEILSWVRKRRIHTKEPSCRA